MLDSIKAWLIVETLDIPAYEAVIWNWTVVLLQLYSQ